MIFYARLGAQTLWDVANAVGARNLVSGAEAIRRQNPDLDVRSPRRDVLPIGTPLQIPRDLR